LNGNQTPVLRGAWSTGHLESNQSLGNRERCHHHTGAVLRFERCRRRSYAIRHSGEWGKDVGSFQFATNVQTPFALTDQGRPDIHHSIDRGDDNLERRLL
jgi:hypothetical protein